MIRFIFVLLISFQVSSQSAYSTNLNFTSESNTQKDKEKKVSILENINESTSRFTRNKYSCIIGKSQSDRPIEADDKELQDINFAFAYLDDDNALDLIQGYDKEPKNEFNITEPLDYKVFLSSKKQFSPRIKTLLARKILVQDFNNDGRDDVFFIAAGNHKPPRKGLKNTILISKKIGYDYVTVSGGSRISHGGAAGDFDQDGDVDVIVANGQQKTVQLLINKGNGEFKAKMFIDSWKHDRKDNYYTAEVWDLDEDGHLDIVLGTPELGLSFFWGKPSNADNPKFSSIQRFSPDIFKNRLPLDMAFADFDGDGNVEMAIIDTRIFDKRYRGWGITLVDFNKSRNPKAVPIYDDDPKQNFHWHGWIDACDVDGDGDIDLSSQMMGNNGLKKYPYVGKIEWINHLNNWNQKIINRAELNKLTNKITNHQKQDKNSNQRKEISNKAINRNMSPNKDTSNMNLCKTALLKSGYDWNTKKPQWVQEAQKRGFSVKDCNCNKSKYCS